MKYEFHASSENKKCREYRFLFATVALRHGPVMCRVCGETCKIVAVHPATIYQDEGGQG